MTRVEKLRAYLEGYYREHGQNLLFHGWHHIAFVTDKAAALAGELGADVEIVTTAALVHDLNYLVDPHSRVTEGEALRKKILSSHSYSAEEMAHIEKIVTTEDMRSRDEHIGIEAQIISDADTLYKCLPVGAPIFTARFLEQTGTSLEKLARNIVTIQAPLIDRGIYFYSQSYKSRYADWAAHNMKTWKLVLDALQDKEVANLLDNVGVKR